uniref:BACK domain-containing protein n=1 Tax=Panagrolaimus sp. PS1159 TaxID=55785 RepID=A0AC35G259_9BILA
MEVQKLEIILWLEFSKLFSLKFASNHFLDLLRSNISDLIYSECFLNAKKDTVKAIAFSRWLNVSEEELFDSILKWAKYNISKDDESFEESLKEILKDILPQIRFPIMHVSYLEKNEDIKILFKTEELENIIFDAKNFANNQKITNASPFIKSLRCWR